MINYLYKAIYVFIFQMQSQVDLQDITLIWFGLHLAIEKDRASVISMLSFSREMSGSSFFPLFPLRTHARSAELNVNVYEEAASYQKVNDHFKRDMSISDINNSISTE